MMLLCLTECFTILGVSKFREKDDLYVVQKQRSTDLEALNLLNALWGLQLLEVDPVYL